MDLTAARTQVWATLLAVGLIMASVSAFPGSAAEFGRVSGSVTDPQGIPLMGATVFLVGPMLPGSQKLDVAAERVITDAHGQFHVERLLPGWYSLKVSLPARLPSLRNGVRVDSGLTSKQNFVLTDIFSSVHVQQPPRGSVSFWGDDWKWVLRTSASTRPVLRLTQTHRSGSANKNPKGHKKDAPASQRLIGMMPGSSSHAPLSSDPGLGSVMAYVRQLSDDADVLVSGSMTANGSAGSSLATAFRRNVASGDPLEVSVAVHQLSFAGPLSIRANQGGAGLSNAQGLVVTYTNTRRLAEAITLTSGMQVDYLNAMREAMVAQPRAKLEIHATPSTTIAVGYGAGNQDNENTLLERVGELNSFPQVTLRNYRPSLESLNHSEVSIDRTLGKQSRLQLAAYNDDFQNIAVWGSGNLQALPWLAGEVLPNTAAEGLTVNGGSYRSSGVRASYEIRLGNNFEAAVLYSVGEALASKDAVVSGGQPVTDLRSALRTAHSESVGGKVSARIPGCKTVLTTSYVYLPRGRVTTVDPYGQASLGMHPYLDFQIRQPLPSIAFIPAHIEALADFRNLLEQGYVPLVGAGDDPLLLSAAYRSFRGGFSVQF
jgi:hypothetical protein